MKVKRLFFVVILAFILVICWLLGVRKISGVDEKKAQEALIKEADAFVERGLYIRAIPLYEEAIEYNIESTQNETEKKLLNAYYEIGSTTSYSKLVEKRIKSGLAEGSEYINVANSNFEIGRYAVGLDFLKQGIENLSAAGSDTSDLVDLFEEYRYTYKTKRLPYLDVKLSANSEILTVFDGELWGYATIDNTELVPCMFSRATEMTDAGYAFVTMSGVDYTITADGLAYGINDGKMDKNSSVVDFDGFATAELTNRLLGVVDGKYGYYGPDFNLLSTDVVYDFISGMEPEVGAAVKNDKGEWAFIDTAGSLTTDFKYDDVALNSRGRAFSGGRACVCEDGKWYVVDINGEHLIADSFEGLKAPEGDAESYIAACDGKGKWGFIDASGELKIDYKYREVYSFSDRVGAVMRSEDDWTYISENGTEITNEIIKWAEPFHNGVAVTGNYEGTITLLIFKYLD